MEWKQNLTDKCIFGGSPIR